MFVAEIDSGATAVVLLGRGTLNFHPVAGNGKGQVKIFCGSDTLETRFDTAYIRLNPADFESFFASFGAADGRRGSARLEAARRTSFVKSRRSRS